ncbi:hypothetical protein SAMN02745116_02471 [Pilibacter termitis]|uniref:Uncharacterized protein n=1 Tax=Pilibacter termitis TaxID=263852 RepID=A0A1T4R798_9ENTE|nr:hypothetical protein [Pilibacter termitis]SKA11972.1 hypothetical protein SAMN02745116_02471 [Pilibacter termitis]
MKKTGYLKYLLLYFITLIAAEYQYNIFSLQNRVAFGKEYLIWKFLSIFFIITMFYFAPLLFGRIFHKTFRFWFILYAILMFNVFFWSYNFSPEPYFMSSFTHGWWTSYDYLLLGLFLIETVLSSLIMSYGASLGAKNDQKNNGHL